ncbi:MAG: hypothetical protein ACK4UU_07050 [Fimbriimonadales bacterium]
MKIMVLTNWVLLLACWLLIVGLLGMLAAVSKGAIVLRRKNVWVFLKSIYGGTYVQRIFLLSSLISIFLAILLFWVYFQVRNP